MLRAFASRSEEAPVFKLRIYCRRMLNTIPPRGAESVSMARKPRGTSDFAIDPRGFRVTP